MFLGIDIGTQSLKAVILDEGLRVCGEGSVGYQPNFPRPGWAEQNPQLWLDALAPAIAVALNAAGMEANDIKAVAVAGQLDGCVPCDAQGKALAPAIIWMDRRADGLMGAMDARFIREQTGLVADATHMGAKIKWLQANYPQTRVWHQPVSFVVAALTGARVMDHALASTTMLYDVRAGAWSDGLFAMFEIDRESLPVCAPSTDVAGTLSRQGAQLTGLNPGTPIAVGTGDDFSNLIGCGIASPGIAGVTLGTAESIGVLHGVPIIDDERLVETHAFPGGAFHLGNPGWLSGGAIRWFQSTFSVGSDAEFSALAATAPAGCDGLLFLPALSGAMAPRWNAKARGAFYGMTPLHGKAHFARAVLEGTAFAMRDVVDRLSALGADTARIRVMGGGAASTTWTQIRADLLGRPIEALEGSDASAVGAALIAAVTGGASPSIARASADLPLSLRRVDPNPADRATLDDAYLRYRRLFDSLEPMFTA